MLFLIEYDRNQGKVVSIQQFDDWQRKRAEKVRLDIELKLNRLGTEREVVLLEAVNEKALRRTHRRYFENLSELMKAS